jgi:L-seryl-tRNA(Ser) seleniumtransferase
MNLKDAKSGALSLLRQIPAVDELLARPALRAAEKRVGRRALVESTRKALDALREQISDSMVTEFSIDDLESQIAADAERAGRFSLQAVINATGVILHTNLGRAPLARKAIEHLAEAAAHYSNLEYDLEQGERGKRDVHTGQLFRELVGADQTLVVNNNAAAVFLVLNTLAEGGEVVVSRGELIEIGGSFRIPDICAKSGAVLREAGTTNRTRLADYSRAIGERTRALLRVHPSNFRITGFTERPNLHDLVELARRHQLPLIEDLGSGCLADLAPLGIHDEPVVADSLKAGADVVTFSGDKLLGGPQAGLILGRREPLERVRKNPLFRALRVDKLTIAALEATVRLYLDGKELDIPAIRMIRMTPEEISARARRLADRIASHPGFLASVEEGKSVIGGGSTPGESLVAMLVAVRHQRHGPEPLEEMLRRGSPPVIARVDRDRLLLDLRTVFEEQDEQISRAFDRLARDLGTCD